MTQRSQRLLLDDTVLPAGLTADEEREACRALKGSMLRQEVYALDGSARDDSHGHPYTVTEQNFTIELLQPRGRNRHAVFFTHPAKRISYHYERNPADPRISHALTLEVDATATSSSPSPSATGAVQTDPAAARRPIRRSRRRRCITYTENDVHQRRSTQDR